MSETLYRIEEVAERTGLTKRAVRYYEEQELFTPEGRSEGGYRLYSEADLERLKQIVALRDALGYTLEEIREVLAVEDELAKIRAANSRGGELSDLIARTERALAILQREVERSTRKLEQIAAVRQKYQERFEKGTRRLAEFKAQAADPSLPSSAHPKA